MTKIITTKQQFNSVLNEDLDGAPLDYRTVANSAVDFNNIKNPYKGLSVYLTDYGKINIVTELCGYSEFILKTETNKEITGISIPTAVFSVLSGTDLNNIDNIITITDNKITLPSGSNYLNLNLSASSEPIYFKNYTISNYITSIEKLATFNYINFEQLPKLSSVNNMYFTDNLSNNNYIFYFCKNLSSISEDFKLSRSATDISHLFHNCTNLSSIPNNFSIQDLVEDASYLFANCNSLEKLSDNFSIGKNTTNIDYMCYGCKCDLPENFYIPKNVLTATSSFYESEIKFNENFKIEENYENSNRSFKQMFYNITCSTFSLNDSFILPSTAINYKKMFAKNSVSCDLPLNFWPSSFCEQNFDLGDRIFTEMLCDNSELSSYGNLNQNLLDNLNRVSGQCQGLFGLSKKLINSMIGKSLNVPQSLYYGYNKYPILQKYKNNSTELTSFFSFGYLPINYLHRLRLRYLFKNNINYYSFVENNNDDPSSYIKYNNDDILFDNAYNIYLITYTPSSTNGIDLANAMTSSNYYYGFERPEFSILSGVNYMSIPNMPFFIKLMKTINLINKKFKNTLSIFYNYKIELSLPYTNNLFNFKCWKKLLYNENNNYSFNSKEIKNIIFKIVNNVKTNSKNASLTSTELLSDYVNNGQNQSKKIILLEKSEIKDELITDDWINLSSYLF